MGILIKEPGKVTGYFVTADQYGRKIEGEIRTCVHCQYSWEYHPNSGIKRGWCIKCNGLLCGKEACLRSCTPIDQQLDIAEKYKWDIQQIEKRYGKLPIFGGD